MNRRIHPEATAPASRPGGSGSEESRPSGQTGVVRLYRVREGDDLRSIARRFFGSADLWIFVYAANQQVRGIRGVHPGQVLCIPELGDLLAE